MIYFIIPFLLKDNWHYKSKTEVRFALTKSFNRIQNANVKYTPNPNPAVTNVI